MASPDARLNRIEKELAQVLDNCDCTLAVDGAEPGPPTVALKPHQLDRTEWIAAVTNKPRAHMPYRAGSMRWRGPVPHLRSRAGVISPGIRRFRRVSLPGFQSIARERAAARIRHRAERVFTPRKAIASTTRLGIGGTGIGRSAFTEGQQLGPGKVMSGRFIAAGVACALVLSCGQGAPGGHSREASSAALHRTPRVLQVGTWHGTTGAFATIQSAVDAALPGDWILIAPGTYHETGSDSDGVRITTPGIHLRGLDRNGVVIDGTRPGFGTCSSDPAAQLLGPGGSGRNGIEVVKTDGVSIENLTVCNFLAGKGGGGNQIWWNGGDGSGVIGMGSYHGAYLTASSTFASETMSGSYGIFASNARGPGLIERSYASNMSDSDFYVGACPDCNAVLREVHAQNSPQGYSGTNAGGHLVIEHSEWDHNRVGIAVTTLATDDRPSPQNGACPDDPSKSCTLIQHNSIHDNNEPNTPAEGIAANVPIGTGIIISGSRNDTIRQNFITANGAWGVLINDYPDPSIGACDGGEPFFNTPPPYDQILGPVIPCYFHAFGNRIESNQFRDNGGFGNPGNADIANAAIDYPVRNCFSGNHAPHGVTTAPVGLQDRDCNGPWVADPAQVPSLFLQVLCDAFGPASGACGSSQYPVPTTITLLPIPRERGMGDPCQDVPPNSWCVGH